MVASSGIGSPLSNTEVPVSIMQDRLLETIRHRGKGESRICHSGKESQSQGPVFCNTHLYATTAARTVDSRYACTWMNGKNAFF
jgi:hypothetical protein